MSLINVSVYILWFGGFPSEVGTHNDTGGIVVARLSTLDLPLSLEADSSRPAYQCWEAGPGVQFSLIDSIEISPHYQECHWAMETVVYRLHTKPKTLLARPRLINVQSFSSQGSASITLPRRHEIRVKHCQSDDSFTHPQLLQATMSLGNL